MLTFTNTIETKEQAVANAKRHREQDMLIAGTYGEGRGKSFRGCSVGCTYKPFEGKVKASSLHALSEPVHGIPEWLTRVRDRIFEGLPDEDRKNWHVDFNEAIPIGVDLDKIKPAFLIMVLESVLDTFDHAENPNVKSAVDNSIALWQRSDIGSEDWLKAAVDAARAARAARAAEAPAGAVAWAVRAARAAEAPAGAVAWAVARAAAQAAWLAWVAAGAVIRAAVDAAVVRAAEAAKYKYFAEQLLILIKQTENN